MASPAGPVVSNTTPLIMLAGIQRLDVLPTLFGEIWIPNAVQDEYQAKRKPREPELAALAWIKVYPATPSAALSATLDVGEAAALTLALASRARLVLIDELKARRAAQRLGLPVTGSLGVLLVAKTQGLIPRVKPIVDQMIAQGRYISPQIRAEILRAAGEDTP